MLRTLKHSIMLNLLPPLVYLFLQLLRMTWKIEHLNREPVTRLWQRGDNVIACFWHGRLLAMPFAYQGQKAKVLISRHRDGEFITRIISKFGLGTVRGSYRKESISSIREMISELRKGTTLAITPDGPKGPRHQVKPGIIELARLTGKPIVPVTCSASRKRFFDSWDRFLLPYPFSKILFLWGDPISFPRDMDPDTTETRRNELQNILISLSEEADRRVCGN